MFVYCDGSIHLSFQGYLAKIPALIANTNALCTLKSSHSFELVSCTPCKPNSSIASSNYCLVTGSSSDMAMYSARSFFVNTITIGTF